MISEYKLYHGAVIAELIAGCPGIVAIRAIENGGRLLNYVVNDKVAIQVKYATQRLRPWHFTFPDSHIDALRELRSLYARTYAVLVCRTDGMIAVHADEVLNQSLDKSEDQHWIRATRKKRELYRLYGPQGQFENKFKITLEPIIEDLAS